MQCDVFSWSLTQTKKKTARVDYLVSNLKCETRPKKTFAVAANQFARRIHRSRRLEAETAPLRSLWKHLSCQFRSLAGVMTAVRVRTAAVDVQHVPHWLMAALCGENQSGEGA